MLKSRCGELVSKSSPEHKENLRSSPCSATNQSCVTNLVTLGMALTCGVLVSSAIK